MFCEFHLNFFFFNQLKKKKRRRGSSRRHLQGECLRAAAQEGTAVTMRVVGSGMLLAILCPFPRP